MQKYLINRFLLVIPTLWLVISILFIALNLLPGDYVTIKLSNLEASGATTQPFDIVGELEAERTLHRVIGGDTLESVALQYGVGVADILANNRNLDASSELRPGSSLIVIEGQLLSVISRRERLALPENTEEGVALLIERNPQIDFPTFAGEPSRRRARRSRCAPAPRSGSLPRSTALRRRTT